MSAPPIIFQSGRDLAWVSVFPPMRVGSSIDHIHSEGEHLSLNIVSLETMS
jgi:hypothetical protein